MKRKPPQKTDRLEVEIFGLVQGVGFRWWLAAEARARQLSGYVINSPVGTVELVAEGSRERLEELLELCYQGTASAEVSQVDFTWQTADGKLEPFKIK
jgi:acylphosphatase